MNADDKARLGIRPVAPFADLEQGSPQVSETAPHPSLVLISKLGFVQTGVQWDERDGEELVFEVELT